MEIRFDDKLVVVTAAGSGFGRAIAQIFAGLGARVHAGDISPDGIAETARGSGIVPKIVDLTARRAVADWIAEIESREGRAIDILINNAGGTLGNRGMPIEDVPDAQWDAIYAINVTTTFVLCRAAAAKMKAARQGRIINISSTAGLRPSQTGLQAYSSTKHAVVGLTRQLSKEFGAFGITVNSIAPGRIPNTPAKVEAWERGGRDRQRNTLDRISLGRLGSNEDIARAAIFFASDLSGFISGQVLAVDGGEW
jgi:3-oxoacyl-[acyl-carrier protein] reductase